MKRTKVPKLAGPAVYSEPTPRPHRIRRQAIGGITDFDLDFTFPLPNFAVGQMAAVHGWVSCQGVALTAWLVDGTNNRIDLPDPTYDNPPPPDPPTWTLQFTPSAAGDFLLTVQGQKGSPPGPVESVSVTVAIAVIAPAIRRSNHRAMRPAKSGKA